MAVTVQMQFESAVTEMYQDAFVGSALENGTTIILFDLRKHVFHAELGTKDRLCWRKEPYAVEIHELSTFHNPLNDAGSGKRNYSRPLPSEPDVKVSLHPAQASQRPGEGPVSSHSTCWLYDTGRKSMPSSAP